MRLRSVLILAAVAALSACGTNPVTGKQELQLVSESQELEIGRQQYAPARQSEGGDLAVLPDVTAYVNEVGQRLAVASDRRLPYEFAVLNNSVPNAWALPGGKIAVNRGLLTQLDNEAELAAVLGHEIVHAAARHGAKAQERGTLMQMGVLAAGIGVSMSDIDAGLGNLIVAGASVGAGLIHTRYGREAELESDLYGTRYMRRAGYDPQAAVTLQEKFVRIAQQEGRRDGWLEGLFATHPPAAERVEQNRRTVAQLPAGGELGVERYAEHLASLRAAQPAYDLHDRALEAAKQKDYAGARRLADDAIRRLPREGRFHQFLGDLAMAEEQPQRAVGHYRKAVELDPGYFGAYLGGGVAWYRLGDRAQAEHWLRQSADRLPTAPAYYYLGSIARDSGRTDQAMQFFRTAAGSQSALGKQAAAEFAALDVPRNPGPYVATAAQLDSRGRVMLRLQNRAPVPLAGIVISPLLVDSAGRVVQQGRPLHVSRVVQPGEQLALDAGLGVLPQEQLNGLRFRVDAASVQR